MIKAVFFDVDGTLLPFKRKQIPQSTKQALEDLQKNGIKIFVSTGRHPAELFKLPVGDIPFDGYVTLNGQLCLDKKRRVIVETPFDQQTTWELVSAFERKKYPLVLLDEEGVYINFVNDTVRKAQEDISTKIPDVSSYRGGSVYQASAFYMREEEAVLEEALPKGCKFARWCDYAVDITPIKGGKVEGIKSICKSVGLEQSEIMAFGDAENDIDMIKFAQIGVAMGNAQDCVKETADYVTTDVNENGIRNALQFFEILL